MPPRKKKVPIEPVPVSTPAEEEVPSKSLVAKSQVAKSQVAKSPPMPPVADADAGRRKRKGPGEEDDRAAKARKDGLEGVLDIVEGEEEVEVEVNSARSNVATLSDGQTSVRPEVVLGSIMGLLLLADSSPSAPQASAGIRGAAETRMARGGGKDGKWERGVGRVWVLGG